MCFATPIIKPNNTDFTVVYPKEVEGECLEAQVKVPRLECREETERVFLKQGELLCTFFIPLCVPGLHRPGGA